MAFEELNLPAHWDCKTLVECTINGNISYGIVQPGQFDPNGVGIIRVNNFQNDHLDVSDVLKVSNEIEGKFSKTRLEGGEVLLTLVGSTGLSAVVPPELKGWNVARAVAVIQPGEEVSADWINICLQSPYTKFFLDSRANTTVQKTLNLKDVKEIPIPIPPKTERVRIEKTLVSLNQKITLNRQINQTLEQMAQTLFKSWFVDFDPVIDNALDAGNDIPDALQERADQRRLLRAKADFKLLPAETRALFPSEFEETKLGWVPKGWEVQAFSEISYILNGCAFKSGDYVEHGNFVLRTRNFTNNQVERYSDDVFLPDSFFESHSQFLCKPYDYHLVMVGASVGNCAIIYPHQLPAFRNQNMWCFRSKKPDFISQSFIKYLLDFVVTKSLGLASGSAREFFRKGDFGDQLVCSGVSDIQILFKNICESYLSKMSMLCAENESLIQLRDSLLPKLISGELVLDALPEVPELAEAL